MASRGSNRGDQSTAGSWPRLAHSTWSPESPWDRWGINGHASTGADCVTASRGGCPQEPRRR